MIITAVVDIMCRGNGRICGINSLLIVIGLCIYPKKIGGGSWKEDVIKLIKWLFILIPEIF